MTAKVYVAEFTGLAATAQGDSVPLLAEPPVAEQIINTGTTTGPINALGSVTAGSGYTGPIATLTPITAGSGYVGPIATLGAITAGSSYAPDAVYPNVALTGGTGSGAKATITVSGGAVTAVVLTVAGTGYVVADTLSATDASLGGGGGSGFSIPVATLVPTVYHGAALTGGTGSGATADITVGSGGTVTTVVLKAKGTGYVVTDALSAVLDGVGTGFSVPVATIVPTVYDQAPLTGGTGAGATAKITVGSGGTVTAVTLEKRGTGYTASDSLGAALDGVGSGFAVAVTSVTERITFGATTNFVEISADGIASIAFGADAVASTTNCRITTTDRIIRRVTPGMEMSAVTNT